MWGSFVLLYASVSYALFFTTIVYFTGFLTNSGVPKSIDSGVCGDPATAILMDLGLVALFGVQHSVMARPAFKRLWTRAIPAALERSTFVLASSLCLLLLFAGWQPIPEPLLIVRHPHGRVLMWAVFWAGNSILLISTFLIDHFELFGLRQAWCVYRGAVMSRIAFQVKGFYRYVRHPIMTGFFLMVWATPDLTLGHALLAGAFSLYILIGVHFEERNLKETLGDRYRAYCEEVPPFFPRLRGLFTA